jgi:mRNA interferase RelE/StbE
MAYRIIMTPEARRNMLDLPRDMARRVHACILALAKTPRPSPTKKLRGPGQYWRVRVGDYRIIYQVEDDKLLVIVVRIGHRREVYR